MPLARSVVRQIAAEHGACLRPVQLRRTDVSTGRVEQILVPCGHTLASVCAPCAERAKVLRAAQCREGWHLDHEPVIDPDDPDDWQRWLVEKRAETQAERDRAGDQGEDAAELDALNGELDEEITRSGVRGKVLPARPARRHRSTRRRQDAPDLPRRKVAARTVGKTYTAPDGTTFRPSMFVTLTCPSYGRVGSDGTPADPDRYDYGRAARDALHFAALFDRFIQNLRRFLGYDVQYFAAVEPQRRLAPHVHIAMRGTVSRAELRQVLAATYHQVWWPDTSAVRYHDGELPVWHEASGNYLDPATGEVLPTWDEALDAIGAEDEPQHVARFGERFDAQGVLAGSRDANRCIGYLTKYLTKHVADCHQAQTPAQHEHAERLAAALRYEPCSPTCANWLRYGVQPRNARRGPAAGRLQGQGPPPRIPRLRGPPRPGLAQVVGQDAGRSPRRPPGLADGHARHPGHRSRPVLLGAGLPRRPGSHATRPADAARRRRPHPLAGSTRRSQAQSRRERAAGSFGNREGGVTDRPPNRHGSAADRRSGGRADEHVSPVRPPADRATADRVREGRPPCPHQ